MAIKTRARPHQKSENWPYLPKNYGFYLGSEWYFVFKQDSFLGYLFLHKHLCHKTIQWYSGASMKVVPLKSRVSDFPPPPLRGCLTLRFITECKSWPMHDHKHMRTMNAGYYTFYPTHLDLRGYHIQGLEWKLVTIVQQNNRNTHH